MSENSPQSSESSPTDPRLKSFLRKAGAIIATEKGVNAASRIKLESLAEHLKLPPELLEEGLIRLQKSSDSFSNLTHYEKAFCRFLQKEFKKLPGDVLSRGMELRAIRLAGKKYEINGTRAEQLIQAEADTAGFSRISQAEAESFATRTIREQIRDQTTIDDELKTKLLTIGERWGIEPEAVGQIIAHRVRENRNQQKLTWGSISRLAVGLTLVVGGLIGSVAMGWIPNWIGLPNALLVNETVADPDVERNGSGGGNETAVALRFPSRIHEQIESLLASDDRLNQSALKILGESPTQRRIGYQQLTREVCRRDDLDQNKVFNLIAELFYNEPDEESAFEITKTLPMFLTPGGSNVALQVGTMRDLKNAYKANRILEELFLQGKELANAATKNSESKTPETNGSELVNAESNSGPVKNFGQRKQNVANCISTYVRIPLDQIKTRSDYRQLSESAIATDQWTRMSQSSWRMPGQVALMTQPLLELTKSKLEPEKLDQFKGEVVLSILKTNEAHWDDLTLPLRESVAGADEVKLMEWVSIFQNSDDSDLQKMLGESILKKIGVTAGSNRPDSIAAAISNYKTQRRGEVLKPVMVRDAKVKLAFQDAYSAVGVVDADKSLSLPDQIAKMVRAVNLGMAFLEGMEKAALIDDASFAKFDRLAEAPTSSLREIISLPIDRSKIRAVAEQPVTASDIRRKESALERLSDLAPDNSGLRGLALNQLERVSVRFDGISYSESTLLAKYFLSDMGTKELLKAQSTIGSFAKWPNLALAIADHLEESDVEFEQALVLSRLLLVRDFEIDEQGDWKKKLRVKIIRAVSENIESLNRQDPENSSSNWARLEIYLNEAYRQRLSVFSASSRNENISAPHQSLVKLIKWLAKARLDRSKRERIERAAELVDALDSNDVDKAIFANQLLIQVLGIELAQLGKSDLVRQLTSEFQIGFKQNQLAGDQLYLTELVLLQLVELKKDLLIEQLLKGK